MALTPQIITSLVNDVIVLNDVKGFGGVPVEIPALATALDLSTLASEVDLAESFHLAHLADAGLITVLSSFDSANLTVDVSTIAVGGDLSGNLPNPTVATVGSSTAANIHTAELLANAATSSSTPSTLVARDSGGNFSAATIIANLSGTASKATNLDGGATGEIAFQSATATTSFSSDLIWNNTNGLGILRTPGTAVDGPYALETTGGITSLDSDGTTGGGIFRAIGYSNTGSFVGYSANGTESAPTQTLNGDLIAFYGAKGADNTGAFTTHGSRAAISMQATETWTTAAQGTQLVFRVTTNGTTSNKNAMTISNSGKIGIGTGTPTSSLQVTGLPVFANNAAAAAGGLTAGAFYRTGADPDPVCVVH